MQQNNYVSVRKLSREEAREIYANMPKEKLIDMLIACNETLDDLYEQQIATPYQNVPYGVYYNCSDWAHCSNPHHDCINCPLMYSSGVGIYTSSSSTISVSDSSEKNK